MSVTPDVDFDELLIDQLPPDKRMPFFKGWFKGLISQIVRLYGIFYAYMNGNSAAYYNGATNYAKDQEVLYNYQIYKSLVSGNTGNNPDASPNHWQLILGSFIGVKERGRYCFRKLLLEYALNRYFKRQLSVNGFVGFIQPNNPITPTNSSIYINTFINPNPSFLVGADETESDSVDEAFSTGWVTLAEVFSTSTTYLFVVNIPVTVYSSIHATPAIAESIVRRFLDRYVISGIYYTIQTY